MNGFRLSVEVILASDGVLICGLAERDALSIMIRSHGQLRHFLARPVLAEAVHI